MDTLIWFKATIAHADGFARTVEFTSRNWSEANACDWSHLPEGTLITVERLED